MGRIRNINRRNDLKPSARVSFCRGSNAQHSTCRGQIDAQIVTETLWWMMRKADPPVAIGSVHVVTTAAAMEAVEELCGEDGHVVMLLLVDNDAHADPSLLDFSRVFSDSNFRVKLEGGCRNRTAVALTGDHSWQAFGMYVTNKMNQFVLDPVMRNITCQRNSTVDFREALRNGSIVLVKIPRGRLTELDVRSLGMLLLGKLFEAALSRGEDLRADRRPMHLYIDEFQNFVTQTAGQMMAEARKYGLRMTLANQTLSQLDEQLRHMVLGNAGNLLSFRLGPMDAKILAPLYEPSLTSRDLQSLPNFHAAARLLFDGAPASSAFVMETRPPRPPQSKNVEAKHIVAESRTAYARPRDEVEAEFRSRHDAK